MSSRLILLPGTLCDRRLFAAVARRLRPSVSVRVARWRELLGAQAPEWWRGGRAINLLGFSLGGIWALQQLGRQPAQGPGRTLCGAWVGQPNIERLALVGSNAEAAGPAHQRRSREQQRLLRRQGTAAVARAAKAQYFAVRPPRWQARLVVDMARRTPAAVARKQLRLAASRADGLHAFAAFPGPVAVMSGLQDRLCSPRQQRRLQSVRQDAYTQAWDRCGHMIPLEAPGRLALAIQRWLAQAPVLESRSATPGVSMR